MTRSEPATLPDDLTERQVRVLRLLRGSLTFTEIATELSLSPNTVKTHTQAIYRKLGVSTREDAVIRGLDRGVIRQAFDAWRQGAGPITDAFAPDMVWRIEGHSAASKEYTRKRQFIDEVLAPFSARFTESEPFRPVTIRAIYADDYTVIVVWTAGGSPTTGSPMRIAMRGL